MVPLISPTVLFGLDVAITARYRREMKEILRTSNPTDIAFASALLKAEGIEYFVLDQNMSIMEGSIGLFPRRMMVVDSDAFMARAVLKDNEIDPGFSE